MERRISVPSAEDPLLVEHFVDSMLHLLHGKNLGVFETEVEDGRTHKNLLHDAELFTVLKALASIRLDLAKSSFTAARQFVAISEYDAVLTHGTWKTTMRRRQAFTIAVADFLFPDAPTVMSNPTLALVHDNSAIYLVAAVAKTRTAFLISVRRHEETHQPSSPIKPRSA